MKGNHDHGQHCRIGTDRSCEIIDGGRAIRFSPCGIVSHNPNDVRERYCGACHEFVRPWCNLYHQMRALEVLRRLNARGSRVTRYLEQRWQR
jgi:hypothetical protein